jgi:trans-aconitate 2-methyltransferase
MRFELGDLRAWSPANPVDVIVSNATLQWVPGHPDLLARLVGALAPGGVLAVQVPANFDQPSHTIRAELAAQAPFAAYLGGVAVPSSHDAGTYLTRLHLLGCAVDAWETTYLHVLAGADAVFDWVVGTGARPTLQALPEGPIRTEFARRLRAGLRAAYAVGPAGVVLSFRRVFFIARSPE